LKWVDSDQQIADDSTKLFAVDKMLMMLKRETCCIVFDSSFTSAKKKRQEIASNLKKAITSGMEKSPDGS
jgi:replicative superfamily II helicase